MTLEHCMKETNAVMSLLEREPSAPLDILEQKPTHLEVFKATILVN